MKHFKVSGTLAIDSVTMHLSGSAHASMRGNMLCTKEVSVNQYEADFALCCKYCSCQYERDFALS